jgi:hypothetical protein
MFGDLIIGQEPGKSEKQEMRDIAGGPWVIESNERGHLTR